MSAGVHAVRSRLRRLADDDQGTTLMELLVGMAVMTVFMSIFLTATLMMTQTANKVEATSISASQTNQAFLRLDKTIRYASAISTPGVSAASGDWYVELDSPPTSVAGSDTCTQLRIDSNKLQQRTWAITNGTAGTASGWTAIASSLTNGAAATGSADVPFTAPAASSAASTTFQRLQVVLVSTSGNATTATNRAQLTFTALNSDVSLASNATTCQQWGRP
ncbi:hypothetical protein [uncultured Jatrophihabitans sp.]|uniref:hypothetical protein n=1 Tax=uncultured Jatrophihabitans sp. TaxID=1610747 RepID=UPI0035C9BBB2